MPRPLTTIDEAGLDLAIRTATREAIRQAVREAVSEQVERALRHATGRLGRPAQRW